MRASSVDWISFTQEWRNSYMEFTRTYTPPSPRATSQGGSSFKTVDEHHHESLIKLLETHGLTGLWSADEVLAISRVWHILEPWPDSSAGLASINRTGIQTCTLSNANQSLTKDLTNYGHLQFTHIFPPEEFRAYKPSPNFYFGAVERLGLRPEECAMVAAHLYDLKAAKECGLHTIYVEREMEEEMSQEEIGAAKNDKVVDCWVGLHDGAEGMKGLIEVARRLIYLA